MCALIIERLQEKSEKFLGVLLVATLMYVSQCRVIR